MDYFERTGSMSEFSSLDCIPDLDGSDIDDMFSDLSTDKSFMQLAIFTQNQIDSNIDWPIHGSPVDENNSTIMNFLE